MHTSVDLTSGSGWDKFCKRLFAGNEVWVEFINPKHNRCGSIGIVDGARATQRGWSGMGRELRSLISVEFPNTGKNEIDITTYRWDICKNIQMLEGYAGPAVRVNQKPTTIQPKEVFDMHDVPIEVGSFCAFNSGNQLVFGSVSKISHGGVVYLNRVNGRATKVIKIKNLAVINEDFRDMMMMRKLAA